MESLFAKSKVVGTTNYAVRWDEIKAGDRLELKREPDNKFDSDAILVMHGPYKIGYLRAKMPDGSKGINHTVVELMGRNPTWPWWAVVDEVTGGSESKPNKGINIEIWFDNVSIPITTSHGTLESDPKPEPVNDAVLYPELKAAEASLLKDLNKIRDGIKEIEDKYVPTLKIGDTMLLGEYALTLSSGKAYLHPHGKWLNEFKKLVSDWPPESEVIGISLIRVQTQEKPPTLAQLREITGEGRPLAEYKTELFAAFGLTEGPSSLKVTKVSEGE